MGRILRPQDIAQVENMYDAQPTKMGRLRKILSGLSDLDSVVSVLWFYLILHYLSLLLYILSHHDQTYIGK